MVGVEKKMKLAVILGDGMADWAVEALGGKTPLEAANHPYMDKICAGRRIRFGEDRARRHETRQRHGESLRIRL